MTASPRFFSVQFDCIRALGLANAVLVAALLCGMRVQAEMPAPHTALVVFGDHRMTGDFWTALVEELHKSQAREAVTVPPLSGQLDVLRGGASIPQLDAEAILSITIIGDCSLIPGPRRSVEGALGWVRREKGEIRPFVHVDCERIVEMLGPVALGMNEKRRNTVMAEAIARVIVHEWVHVATQNPGHTKSGVMQSQFQLGDLLADDEQIYPRQDAGHRRKRSSGF